MLQWDELRKALRKVDKNTFTTVKLMGDKEASTLVVWMMLSVREAAEYKVFAHIKEDFTAVIEAVELDKLLGYIKDIPSIEATSETEIRDEKIGTKADGSPLLKKVEYRTDTITIIGGGRTISTSHTYSSDFPEIDVTEDPAIASAPIDGKIWDIVLRANEFTYRDTDEAIIRNVFIHSDFIVSTNGSYMYKCKHNLQLGCEAIVSIPRLYFNKNDLQRIEITDRFMRLVGDGYIIISKLIEGNYPNFFSVIPDIGTLMDTIDLTQEVYDLCGLVSKSDGGRVQFTDKGCYLVELVARGGAKEYKSLVASKKHGDNQEGAEIIIKAEYLMLLHKLGFNTLRFKDVAIPVEVSSDNPHEKVYMMGMRK